MDGTSDATLRAPKTPLDAFFEEWEQAARAEFEEARKTLRGPALERIRRKFLRMLQALGALRRQVVRLGRSGQWLPTRKLLFQCHAGAAQCYLRGRLPQRVRERAFDAAWSELAVVLDKAIGFGWFVLDVQAYYRKAARRIATRVGRREERALAELMPTGEEFDAMPQGERNVSCFREARRSFGDHAQQIGFHRELHTRLGRADAILPPRQAQIVRYTLVDQLDDDEIAKTMGIEKTTLIEQRSRALKKLEEEFGHPKMAISA